MSKSSLGHTPSTSRWQFDEEVTDCFDDMLTRSIPQYSVMRNTVAQLASRFLSNDATHLDLGCSRGGAIRSIKRSLGDKRPLHIGVEISLPMVQAATSAFEGDDTVSIRHGDLRDAARSTYDNLCCVTAVLALQFVPINYRQGIIRDVYDRLNSNAAFIVVEKVLGEGAAMQDVQVDAYHAFKESQGYTRAEIDAKCAALEGVLVPVTASMNEAMLRGAGFREVDCVWRWMNFGAWIAIK